MNHDPITVVASTEPVIALAAAAGSLPGRTESCQGLGAAIAAISPATDILVVDAAIDAPLVRLLARLFVDRRAGRRAIVVEAGTGHPERFEDDRIAVMPRAVALANEGRALLEAVGGHAVIASLERQGLHVVEAALAAV